MMLGSAKNEHPRLTSYEIIFEVTVIKIPQRHGQTTFRSNTALCTASCGN